MTVTERAILESSVIVQDNTCKHVVFERSLDK